MDLSHDDVQNILRIIDASPLEELHLEIGEFMLVVRKRGIRANGASPTVAETGDATVRVATPAAGVRPAPQGARPGMVEVRAPMVGAFYRSPAPAAPPFVEVGAKVEPDDVVGNIEVMKLMNSIRAGGRGRVVEILAENGELVEYGQLLVVIEPIQ